MPQWNRVLCALDFSDSSRFAMKEAAGLASRFGADLTLIHVFTPPVASGVDLLAAGPDAVLQRQVDEITPALAQWKAEAERLAGRAVSTAVETGEPGAEIARFANERQFALVVLGSHGRTGVKRLLLGSVAERVVRGAKCSVLVVRPPAAD